jgi:hypothetical protein
VSIVYKVTITRPDFDSLCFFEVLPHYDFTDDFPCSNGCTLSYEPVITWSELYSRKHELRPDLLFVINSIDIESIISNPHIYGSYPLWNPFSLSYTHLITYPTIDVLNLPEPYTSIKNAIHTVGSTVTYEELFVDGIIDTTFVKKYI